MKTYILIAISVPYLCITFTISLYNFLNHDIKVRELKLDEQRSAPSVFPPNIFSLPGIPPMPDHLPEFPDKPDTI